MLQLSEFEKKKVEKNMNEIKEKIKEILIKELGYSNYVAEITTNDLMNMKPELKSVLDEWLETRVEKEININGISLKNLIKKKGLTYPSALISLNWLLVEPEVAIHELMSDVKGRNDF